MAAQWYTRFQGKVQGPFSVEDLLTRAKRGKFNKLHEVSPDGANWSKASAHPELFPAAPAIPVRAAPALPKQPPSSSTASLAPSSEVDSGTYGLSSEPRSQPPSLIPVQAPAAPQPSPTPAPAEEGVWYYSRGTEDVGPVSFSDLQWLANSCQLLPDEMVWRDGLGDWVQANQIPGLFAPGTITTTSPSAGGGTSRVSPLAVVSFVLGLAGITVLPFLGSIAAVAVGFGAFQQIKRTRLEGRGLALAGVILGAVGILGALIFLAFLALG